MQSFLAMYSLHQLCFCLQPYSRISATFKPKFKSRNVRFEIFEVFAIANEEGRDAMGLVFLTSFSCNSIQDSRVVPHFIALTKG